VSLASARVAVQLDQEKKLWTPAPEHGETEEACIVSHLTQLAIRAVTAVAFLAVAATALFAEPQYGPGASDKVIRIGQTMPYSGPASVYSVVGKVEAAYFDMINQKGGVNGRRIELLSYDDGLNPAKTVEQTRRLVERDDVLFIFQSLGTASNIAVQKYLNDKKVPQLFVAARATNFEDPEKFPWTMGFAPSTKTEAAVYGEFITENFPDARVGILYENNDSGKDALAGLKEGLGAKGAKMIVKEASYEATDPTVHTQIIAMKGAGVDLLVNMTSPKFAIQSIKKMADLKWEPVHILGVGSASIDAVLKPAGLENTKGIISASSFKEVSDPAWTNDPGVNGWSDFMDKHYPQGERNSIFNTYGYSAAELLVKLLEQCGDNLTRENVMKQAANLKNVELSLLLPGMTIDTSPTDYRVIQQFQMMRFNGAEWERFGPVSTH
jgi:ABC-type branched-subunit amino acid transport system substrate-binding protein